MKPISIDLLEYICDEFDEENDGKNRNDLSARVVFEFVCKKIGLECDGDHLPC